MIYDMQKWIDTIRDAEPSLVNIAIVVVETSPSSITGYMTRLSMAGLGDCMSPSDFRREIKKQVE
jgi:hypothetical protein